jgi:hypothetical protein
MSLVLVTELLLVWTMVVPTWVVACLRSDAAALLLFEASVSKRSSTANP